MGVLGKKLALLITILAGGQRSQTIHKINAGDIHTIDSKCILPILAKLKQTKPHIHMKPLEFRVYLKEPTLV